ncbi:hypothetical protein B0H21DRAFT_893562 [Amylocystis lapponica]|nr:hypothetical protein B0H21DRAFT_893719 [Amylocystis lapponica]KAH9940652.1 hypothetical protein B0H21DRAFT_893562 [Amylocystis lapponica]
MVYDTRKKNADTHPGNIVLQSQQKRRSAEEMVEVRRFEAEARKRREGKKAAQAKDVSDVKSRMRLEDVDGASQGLLPQKVAPLRLTSNASESPAVTTGTLPIGHGRGRSTLACAAEASGDESGDDLMAAETPPLTKSAGKQKAIAKPPAASGKRKHSLSESSIAKPTKGVKKFKPAPSHPSGLLTTWLPGKGRENKASRKSAKATTAVSGQGKNVPPTATDVHDYAGYVSSDNDDTEERAAMHAKDVNKDMHRKTTKGIVAIAREEPSKLIAAEAAVTEATAGGSGNKAKKADLPLGAHPRWNKKFIPTYLDFMGTLPNPWDTSAFDLVAVLQDIWDQVYPDIPYSVTLQGAVSALAKQKVYEWRTGIAKAGLLAVAAFFQSSANDVMEERNIPLDDDGRAELVAQQVGPKLLFLYGKVGVSHDDDGVCTFSVRKPFTSAVVSRTLAFHLNVTKTAVGYSQAPPCGALALSLIAAERAFQMWTTGKFIEVEKGDNFSELLWGDVLNLYRTSIDGLSMDRWDLIVDSAGAADVATGAAAPALASDDANNVDADVRALVVDQDEDEDSSADEHAY